MTTKEHRKRHKELHHALDELIADWAAHQRFPGPGEEPKVYSNTTIAELMEWSYQQTVKPTPPWGERE